MNVFEVLRKDHQEARMLFQQIEQLGPSNTRQQLFETLKGELLRHTKAEEEAFYPKLEDQKPTHDLIEEAVHEHDQVKKMLEEIDRLPPDSDDWLKAVREMKACVEHHVQEEENELFPKAQQIIGGEADRLAEKVQQAKH